MRNTLLLTVLVSFFGSPQALDAAVFERDLNAPGDGLLTYDEVNRREWLDLPETGGVQLADVITQMAPGARLEGFAFAALEDVSELAASAGVGWMQPWTIPGNDEPNVDELVDLLGWVIQMTGGLLPDTHVSFGLIAKGFVDSNPLFDDTNFYVFSMYDGVPLMPGTVNSPIYHNQTPRGGVFIDAPASFELFPDLPPLGEGEIGPFWLYRNSIPEPSTMVFDLTGSLLFSAPLRTLR